MNPSLEARIQQIDLERRQKQYDTAEALYQKLMKQIPSKHVKYKNMKTWISMQYARFQFKTCSNAEKALAELRKALKKERGNPKLYRSKDMNKEKNFASLVTVVRSTLSMMFGWLYFYEK